MFEMEEVIGDQQMLMELNSKEVTVESKLNEESKSLLPIPERPPTAGGLSSNT